MLNQLTTSNPSSSGARAPAGGGPPAVPASVVDESYEAFRTAIEAVPKQSSPGIAVIGALKDLWAKSRAHARDINRARGGRASGEYLSGAADRILRTLLDYAGNKVGARTGTPGIAVLALGSYGRREFAPFSDWDLLILHSGTSAERESGDSRLEQLVGAMLRCLWDAGMHLGHAVRTPSECIAVMEDESAQNNAVETATALLEARFVAGDSVLASLFLKKDLEDFFKRRGKHFVERKLEEAMARHRRQGTSVYQTQPNLKESPGSLRDYQLSLWIDRAAQLSGHLPRLAKRPLVSQEAIADATRGYETILSFRTALHGLSGRKQDVMDYQMQQALAEELGLYGTEELRASEVLLREYFRAATGIYRLADTVIRRYREEQAIVSRDIERLRRRPVDEAFTRVGDYLYAARPGLFSGEDWLERAMLAYLHATRLNIRVSQEVGSGIREQLPRMTEETRRRPEAARLFLELMARRSGVFYALRSMRDIGLLGEYIPEFAEIQGLVIQDIFHDFSVDEHTLFVCEKVDRFYDTSDNAHRQRREILDRLKRPVLLRLSCLMHDLGKSRGGPGHSRRGAEMVPTICERLGLSPADTKILIFLVEQHLLLSRTSSRRDPGEGGLLAELGEKIASRERLDMLYLLTCADGMAVGSGSFPHWKDELLTDLYRRLEQRFLPQGAPAEAQAQAQPAAEREDEGGSLEAQMLARAGTEEEKERIREHCARVPPRYLVESTPDDANLHLELIGVMREKKREAAAAVRGSGGLVDLWVVSTDRPRRFSQIAGAFLGSGVNIVSAIAYTRSDGIILDHFRASLGQDFGVYESDATEAWWGKVADEITATLNGGSDYRAKIEAARRRIPRAPIITVRVEPEVRIDNKFSSRYTVVDVVCGDRIGVLYALSRALGDLGCDIHFAKIDTQQGLATFVYYVSEIGGGQIVDAERAHNIRLLLKAVANDFQAARR
ncbi:MAG: [protein-PII] uridylyltransferase [Planctomycetota bacterium]|nr:[protein-PII] uridylyltransferase [Planctomycetota bacterium]